MGSCGQWQLSRLLRDNRNPEFSVSGFLFSNFTGIRRELSSLFVRFVRSGFFPVSFLFPAPSLILPPALFPLNDNYFSGCVLPVGSSISDRGFGI